MLRERFFDPLELDETFSQCEAPPPPGSARGYLVRPERAVGLDDGTDYRPTLSAATVACAVGDIVSTSTDLADWARAVYGGHLLDPDSLALMTDYDYSAYSDETYGLGTRTRVLDGERLFGHTGSLRGFDAAMWHAPAVDLTIVVLTNRGRIDANPIIDALAAVALPYAEAYQAGRQPDGVHGLCHEPGKHPLPGCCSRPTPLHAEEHWPFDVIFVLCCRDLNPDSSRNRIRGPTYPTSDQNAR